MAVAAEVQSWIEQMRTAGASEDWIKGTLAMFEGNEKVQAAAKETVLAQSDYTRRQQELAKLEKQQKDELEKTTNWQKQLATWKKGEDEAKVAAMKAKEQAEAALALTKSRLKSLKEQGYLDDTMLDGIDVATAAPPAAAPAEPAKGPSYLTKEDGITYSINTLKINDQLADLRDEHSRLFHGVENSPKFSGAAVVDYVNEKGVKPQEAWEALYGVPARRETVRKAEEDARVESRVKDEVAKRISAEVMAGRPVRSDAPPSVMQRMSAIPDLKGQNPYQRAQQRVQKAVAGLEAGRRN